MSTDPEEVGEAWDEALASHMPVVIEFKTDPEVPPLPPHISFEQMRNFTSMLLKGDERESAILKGASRQALSAILPGDK